jgi:hypothetical protein
VGGNGDEGKGGLLEIPSQVVVIRLGVQGRWKHGIFDIGHASPLEAMCFAQHTLISNGG